MKRTLVLLAASIMLGTAPLPSSAEAASLAPKNEISRAEYYLKEFEKEVSHQHGGAASFYRNKRDAVDRVKRLVQGYPDDPAVQALFHRTRTALLKSKGDYMEITPAMTAYRRNEQEMRERFSRMSAEAWKKKLAAVEVLSPAFPAPDPMEVTPSDIIGKHVAIKDVVYPSNQFIGATGEYAFAGKPSTGFYFIQLNSRRWLAPYEAVKRFRRQVDASIGDTISFTVLGKITGVVMESPDASQQKKAPFVWGWVVQPDSLYVDGHVLASYDDTHEQAAAFVGEETVNDIKQSWYTVKSIPPDVTPEGLMDIFQAAIKEKNFELYQNCINPARWETPTGKSLVRYHWDLHQARFQKQYVHAVFDKAKIKVVKGHDSRDKDENFFLSDFDREKIIKMSGEMEERAIVTSRAFDENGKQVGGRHPHELIRKGGDAGRWYVEDYAARF
ncbi:MAG: hypothetical protein IJB53_09800 [Mailhella sp.]|nr:hypothetical protein [Mailhella sp.]